MKTKLFIVLIFISNAKANVWEGAPWENLRGEERYWAKLSYEYAIAKDHEDDRKAEEYRKKINLPENQVKIKKRIYQQLRQSNLITSDNKQLPNEMLDIIADHTVAEFLNMNNDQLLDNRSLIDDLVSGPLPVKEQKTFAVIVGEIFARFFE